MRQQQEITISECLLYLLIFYSTIIHFICSNFVDNLQEKEIPTLRELPQQVATEIQIVSDREKCPSYYSSMIQFDWPGLSQGYYCEDGKIYKKDDYNKNRESCQLLEQILKQKMQTFGVQNINKGVIQSFKICGNLIDVEKKIVNENSGNSDLQNTYQVRKVNSQVKYNTMEQQNSEKQENKRFLDIDQNNTNKKVYCQKGQKSCKYQKIVFCIGKNERCPISNIFIQQSSQDRNIGQEVIYIGDDLQLVIEREDNYRQPIVELAVSESEGVCLENKNKVYKQYYELDNREQCDQINQEYRQLFKPDSFITSKQFYEINHINIAEHAEHIPDNERYTLFAKQYTFSETNQFICISDSEYYEITENVADTRSFSRFLNYLSVVIVVLMLLTLIGKKPPRLILPYINPLKVQNFLLMLALFVYLNTLWILLVIQYNLGEVREDLIKFSTKECLDNNKKSQIRKYLTRNSHEIQFGFLMAALYIPLIIFLVCSAVKRFCWMRTFNNLVNNPQNQQELQARRRLIHR